MKLKLMSGNECVATRELTTEQDYARIANASILEWRGNHYVFRSMAKGHVIFEHTDTPLACVDGFVEPTRGG